MAFKRAEWHSGLTYRQTCEECNTTVVYMDDKLDFRPWFADGFVYCPKCRKPLRHREEYAIDSAPAQVVDQTAPTPSPVIDITPDTPPAPVPGTLGNFCTGCGKAFGPDDRFCSGCGKKRT